MTLAAVVALVLYVALLAVRGYHWQHGYRLD
jgi:hypothetical protein